MNGWRLKREKLLKDGEWEQLRNHLESRLTGWTGIQDHAICMTAIWTGLRRAELADLKVEDIQFGDRPYIIVRHGKGDKYREVLISKDCSDFLSRFLQNRCVSGNYLFVPQRGEKYTGDGIYRVWKTALESANLPHRSIHKARHYYATKLHETTKDLVFLKDQLGHTSLNTTQVYAHVSEKQAEKYLNDFDKKL